MVQLLYETRIDRDTKDGRLRRRSTYRSSLRRSFRSRPLAALFDTLKDQFDGTCLVRTQRGAQLSSFQSFGVDSTYLAALPDYWNRNPYPEDNLLRLPLGKAVFSDVHTDRANLLASDFYNEWMHPQGISSDHLYVTFHRAGSGTASLAVAPHRTVFHEDRAKYLDRLNRIIPHLIRAAEISSLAHSRVNQPNVLLDIYPAPAFLVSASGKILTLNSAAERLLAHSSLMSVRGALRARHGAGQRSLDRLMRQAELSTGLAGPIRIAGPSDLLLLWAIDTTRRRNMISAPAFWDVSVPERSILIIATPARSTLDLAPEIIKTAFELTATEARVASALASGQSIAAYAEASGVSEFTVRKHVAAILRKTGTGGQSALVALLARTVGVMHLTA